MLLLTLPLWFGGHGGWGWGPHGCFQIVMVGWQLAVVVVCRCSQHTRARMCGWWGQPPLPLPGGVVQLNPNHGQAVVGSYYTVRCTAS